MNEINESIAVRFMCHAKGCLEKPLYDRLYSMAVGDVKAIIQPKKKKEKPVMHVVERLKERYDLESSKVNLQELASIILSGKNIKVQSKKLHMIEEIDVIYKGQVISVIYNRTQNKLVTALPRKK